MALNFPANPSDGQTYESNGKSWIFNGSRGIWISANSGSQQGADLAYIIGFRHRPLGKFGG